MAEPPFQMPGHRWDPDKKRFFKILPGQSQAESSQRADQSKAGGSKSNKAGKKRAKDDDEASQGKVYASTLPLPAIYDRNATASKAFSCSLIDPVVLRQQGRTSWTAARSYEQSRIQAAYSHLALFRAKRPSPDPSSQHTVAGLQTDADEQSMLASSNHETIVRLSPLHSALEVIAVGHRLTPALFLRTSKGLLHEPTEHDRSFLGVHYLLLGPEKDPLELPQDGGVWAAHLRFPIKIEAHPLASWALHETSTASQPCPSPSTTSLQRDATIVLAVTTCKKVYFFVKGSEKLAFRAQYEQFQFKDSDCMTITFDQSGKILYCGLRSGAVLTLRWEQHRNVRLAGAFAGTKDPFITLINKGASVTNLSVVSPFELVVVRINGEVELVDTTTGEVKRCFQGHVNSYDFHLGFAIDVDLRLLALAGLDRKVRVWSLDSALPLGTASLTLPHVYHAPTNPVEEKQQSDDHLGATLWDESTSATFSKAHPATNEMPAMRKGLTLSNVTFPTEARALHWHPRFATEGCDPHEMHAMRQEEGGEAKMPSKRWKDLYVGAGEWMYQFRWP